MRNFRNIKRGRVLLRSMLALFLALMLALALGACGSEGEAPAPEGAAGDASAGQNETADGASPVCTLSVSCALVFDHEDMLDSSKKEIIPENGWFLEPAEVAFDEGQTAFDLLQNSCRAAGIPLEFSETPGTGGAYLEGIGNLYTFDCGQMSGWIYKVNGEYPLDAANQYVLSDGDVVEFIYACTMTEMGW